MALVALCYGTRPQIIKASILRKSLANGHRVRAIDTGQHYDYELNALLYEQLGVQVPDEFLYVGSAAHATQLAAILGGAAASFQRERPDIVVVIGDTNSTLGCALAAAQLRIPVVHVEAGLRAVDALMAEEINRRAVDAIAHVLCAPSVAAAARLARERDDAVIVETGDVARDVLDGNLARIPVMGSESPLPTEPFVFATLHRAELTSSATCLRRVVDSLANIGLPVIFPAHPRTRIALQAAGITIPAERVTLLQPLGYLETLACVRGASAVVTDSGGIQREAYWLGTPCITVRRETEWSETVALGANTLCSPSDITDLVSAVNKAVAGPRDWYRDSYGDGTASVRIGAAVNAFLSEVTPRVEAR
jgi:UDP-N-acetylglucosamine 2-epimerase